MNLYLPEPRHHKRLAVNRPRSTRCLPLPVFQRCGRESFVVAGSQPDGTKNSVTLSRKDGTISWAIFDPVQLRKTNPYDAQGTAFDSPVDWLVVRGMRLAEHLRPRPVDPSIGASGGSIGAPGFEPGTFWSQTRRATKLRYAPRNESRLYHNAKFGVPIQAR